MNTTIRCLECGQPISRGLYLFSKRIYGHSLCLKDQCRIEGSGARAETVDLYLALRARHLRVVLEYFDDHTFIDIALPDTLYIEVYDSSRRFMTDLFGILNETKKNIPTIIISQSMLEDPASFEYVVNEISKACRILTKRTIITGMDLSFSPVQLQ